MRNARVYIAQIPSQRLYTCVECRAEQRSWIGSCPSCGAVGSRGAWRWVNKEIDLTTASEYGDPIVVWPPSNTGAAMTREQFENEALQVAEKFDDTLDYVVALGSPTLIAVLGWAIGLKGKTLRILEWDKRGRRYHPTFGMELDDITD